MNADERARVFIGMGSNLGNSPETLLAAWETLGQEPAIKLVELSSPYVSAPVDMHSQHWFTNAVGELRTALSPMELLKTLLEVEASLGRERKDQAFGYQDRTIDLDLLYYGEYSQDDPDLVLPHPHLHDRLFVLKPMLELAPDFFDTKRGRTVKDMYDRLLARMEEGSVKKQEINRSIWPKI